MLIKVLTLIWYCDLIDYRRKQQNGGV